MATINLGAIKFNWKGPYNNGTAYVVDDVVSSGGSSYVCILASQGNAVSSGTYWQIMSSAGTNGNDADLLNIGSTAQGDLYYNNGGAIARLGAGTSGQFLKTSGTGANPVWADAGGGLQSQQVFTANGTYTKPSGIKKIKVTLTGGGAGGGSGTSSHNPGGGGGAGGTSIEIIDVSSLSSTVAVTVGAGGTAAAAGANQTGAAGGTTSFGSYLSATGGTGGYDATGTTAATSGRGGLGSNGQINLRGGWGGEHGANNAQDNVGGGHGGSSFWGGGGRKANDWSSTHAKGGTDVAIGAGGGAGIHSNYPGATGNGGIVVIEEYK